MPLAVTHIVLTLVLIDLFRKYVLKKKKFPLYLVLIGGVAGLLPDIDIFIYWLVSSFSTITLSQLHHTYTHNLIIPIILVLFGVLTRKWEKISHLSFVISIGWAVHVVLDSIFSSSPIFYPFSSKEFGLHLIPPDFLSGSFFIGLDAIILLAWLVYEWKYKNIKDYI
jgi:membrane-bound metal-dependent hydrolase YbcI (DUF457 family)